MDSSSRTMGSLTLRSTLSTCRGNPIDNSLFRMLPEQALTKWLPAVFIAAAMVYFYAFLYLYAYNIPFADDISDTLSFLIDASQSQEWTHTTELLFTQINEHRSLSTRLVYFLDYILEGEANFRTLIFLANLAEPLLLIMFFLAIRDQRHSLLILLPAALILFQLRTYGTTFWAMNAFAFMFNFVYGFACLLFLSKVSPARLAAAIVFATLATFTLASGQLIWLVGLVSVLHQTLVLRNGSTTLCFVWFIAAVIVLAVYRIDYVNQISIPLMLTSFVDSPIDTSYLFLVLLGRAFSDSSELLSAGAGVTLLLVVSWFTICGIRRNNIVLELFAGYIVLSVLTVALARGAMAELFGASISDEGMFYTFAFAERYTFSSVLLLATTVTLLLARTPGERGQSMMIIGAIVLACAYCISSYYVSREGLQSKLTYLIGSHNNHNYWSLLDVEKKSGKLVTEAISLGVYDPPEKPLPAPVVTSLISLESLQQPPGNTHEE